MTKSTIVALIATLGLSVSATAGSTSVVKVSKSLYAKSMTSMGNSVDMMMGSANTLLDSTARGLSKDGYALSYNVVQKGSGLVQKGSEATVTVSRGTWTVSTNASAAVTEPIWGAAKQSGKAVVNSAIFKKIGNVSIDVLTSDAAINSRNTSNNVSAEYWDASKGAASTTYNFSKGGVKFAANAASKAVTVSVNGTKAVANWSTNQVVAVSQEGGVTRLSQGGKNLSAMVSAKFVNALKSSAKASTDLVYNTDWAESGLTVSIVKASKATVAGSRTVATSLWVVVTTGSADAYNNISEGEYSQASEVLLMLPLQSVQGASAVSTSTQKDDEY